MLRRRPPLFQVNNLVIVLRLLLRLPTLLRYLISKASIWCVFLAAAFCAVKVLYRLVEAAPAACTVKRKGWGSVRLGLNWLSSCCCRHNILFVKTFFFGLLRRTCLMLFQISTCSWFALQQLESCLLLFNTGRAALRTNFTDLIFLQDLFKFAELLFRVPCAFWDHTSSMTGSVRVWNHELIWRSKRGRTISGRLSLLVVWVVLDFGFIGLFTCTFGVVS